MPTPFPLRKTLLAVTAVAALALTGCTSTDAASDAAKQESETRTVAQATGDVTIPADPQHIVALDEYAALELLSIGVKPSVVYRSLQSPMAKTVLENVEGLELIDAPTFLASPDLEDVASKDGDVIVVSGTGPVLPMLEQISEVGPTVVVPNENWRDSLEFVGEAFGAETQAKHVAEVIESRFDEVAKVAPDLGTVSVLFGFQGMILTPSANAPLSGEIVDAGVERIAVQASTDAPPESDNTVLVAAETLPEHAADITILLDEGYYEAQTVLDAPTFAAGKSVRVDGDVWFGQNPFGVFWVQEDLKAIAAGDDAGTVAQDTEERWAAFMSAVQ